LGTEATEYHYPGWANHSCLSTRREAALETARFQIFQD
jgi:hypothetical protein